MMNQQFLMQQHFNQQLGMLGMQGMQPNPITVNISTKQQMPDGSSKNIDQTISINQLEHSIDLSQKIKNACDLINQGQNQAGLDIFTKLAEEKKINFSMSAVNQNNMENAEQNAQMGK